VKIGFEKAKNRGDYELRIKKKRKKSSQKKKKTPQLVKRRET